MGKVNDEDEVEDADEDNEREEEALYPWLIAWNGRLTGERIRRWKVSLRYHGQWESMWR